MVPKVAGKGASFKGAGLYYLHDKGAGSAERVAFTHTENLPTSDPERALKCMAYTAMHQNEIKEAAGGAKTGRKLTQPVYTYSLSWAPGERPTQEQMIAAGKESLEALGLQGHETLMVAHNDQAHPHLHVIVNRVHPETGKAAKLSNDHLILSRWAEAYERRQGEIRCEQRVENNAARRRGEFMKASRGIDPATFQKWRHHRLGQAFAVRQAEARNLSAYHLGQRQALYDEKERRIREVREEVRERNRPKWAALYREQKAERRQLEKFQASPVSRLAYWLRHRDLDRWESLYTGQQNTLLNALKSITGKHHQRHALAAKHEAQRAALAKEVGEQTRSEISAENQRYQRQLDRLKRTQTQERSAQQQEHSHESEELARDIKTGRDAEQYLKETAPSLGDEFARRVSQRIKEAKKRDEERRKDRDLGRERER